MTLSPSQLQTVRRALQKATRRVELELRHGLNRPQGKLTLDQSEALEKEMREFVELDQLIKQHQQLCTTTRNNGNGYSLSQVNECLSPSVTERKNS